jgi:hypothetical protein
MSAPLAPVYFARPDSAEIAFHSAKVLCHKFCARFGHGCPLATVPWAHVINYLLGFSHGWPQAPTPMWGRVSVHNACRATYTELYHSGWSCIVLLL